MLVIFSQINAALIVLNLMLYLVHQKLITTFVFIVLCIMCINTVAQASYTNNDLIVLLIVWSVVVLAMLA